MVRHQKDQATAFTRPLSGQVAHFKNAFRRHRCAILVRGQQLPDRRVEVTLQEQRALVRPPVPGCGNDLLAQRIAQAHQRGRKTRHPGAKPACVHAANEGFDFATPRIVHGVHGQAG
ncbi:hypothetical protein D9M68_890950 [compost metagenome]